MHDTGKTITADKSTSSVWSIRKSHGQSWLNLHGLVLYIAAGLDSFCYVIITMRNSWTCMKVGWRAFFGHSTKYWSLWSLYNGNTRYWISCLSPPLVLPLTAGMTLVFSQVWSLGFTSWRRLYSRPQSGIAVTIWVVSSSVLSAWLGSASLYSWLVHWGDLNCYKDFHVYLDIGGLHSSLMTFLDVAICLSCLIMENLLSLKVWYKWS